MLEEKTPARGRRPIALSLFIALLAVAAATPVALATHVGSTGAIPVLGSGGSVQISARLDVAADDLSVPAADRKARLTLVLENTGAATQVALCPMLNFAGAAGTVQGYTYFAGDGTPDCTNPASHPPSVSTTLDPLPAAPPACPAPAPVAGDIVTVPAAAGATPGGLVLVYEVGLAQLGAGLETLSPAAVRAALLGGGGTRLEVLSGFGGGIATLVCPAGVGAFLAAPPDASVASSDTSVWYQPAIPAVSPSVQVTTSLSSAATFGAAADITAKVSLLWQDNLASHLSGNLTHNPAEGTSFTLAKGSFATGTLTATFPSDLPEGFVGQATVVVTDAGSGAELARSIHLFAVDTTPPAITAAASARGDADLTVRVTAADTGSFLNSASLAPTVDGAARPAQLMDLTAGNFDGPTSLATTVAPIASANKVGATATASDDLGNAGSAILPVAGAGVDRTVECDSFQGGHVTLDGSLSSFDPAHTPTFTWNNSFGTVTGETAPVVLPLGAHDITLSLADDRAFTGTDGVVISVADTTPPVIASIVIPNGCLWPPNHKYVRYELLKDVLVTASDVCDPTLRFQIVGVTSSQGDKAHGSGNTSNDVVFGPGGFCVRSERTGGDKDGRVYTVKVQVIDDSGNATTGTAFVRVAHDQSGHDCPAVDPSLFVEDSACTAESFPAIPDAGGNDSGGTGASSGSGGTGDGSGTTDPGAGKKHKKHKKHHGGGGSGR